MGKLEEKTAVIPGVRSGQAVIRGTRTTVADILSLLASGASESEILEDFPWLKSDDIRMAEFGKSHAGVLVHRP